MYKRHILSNGIKVIFEHIPYVNSISIGVWIKSGSRYENKVNNGISHFIEHMLFKGSKNRSSKQISEEIEFLGGQLNAFTAKESTCYYVKLLDNHFKNGIDVLSDIVINPLFTEEDIEKEKSVVIEEISMYEDLAEDVVSDLQSKGIWGENPLAYPILGTYETVSGFTRESILDYYNERYTTDNTIISVAGNFKEDELISELEEKFNNFRKSNNALQCDDTPSYSNHILVKNKPIEQVHVTLTLKGLKSGDEGLYSLLAVNSFFGSGTSSKLFQIIREEKGYVYTIYSYPSSYKNCGIFSIYFACNPAYLEDAMKLIREEIKSLHKNKMSEEEISKIKEQLKGSYILGLEGVSNLMFGMGKAELTLGKTKTPAETLEKIDNITKEDVDKVIDYVFEDGIISAAVVGKDITTDEFESYILN
ncbi:MAG: pitrilysin family protein [Clostridium sp.]|uniref:M16 family metallopeptidase n=1 Tax=Clostridium sp. TaxID=1506 RepID=UPI002FCAEC9E